MLTLGLADGIDSNEGDLGGGIPAGEICASSGGGTALGTDDPCDHKSDGTVEIGSSKRDPLSRMSVLVEIDETVDTVEGVLVKVTGGRSGDNIGVGTGVVEGARSEGEGTVGGGEGDGVADTETDAETDIDTLGVGVTDGDDDE
jgi:hypothetical protein